MKTLRVEDIVVGDKMAPLDEAVRKYVTPGSVVFIGGFGQGVPFAIGREIVRQGISGLTLCRTGADIFFDILVGAGAVEKLIVGWFGNPGIGISHVCRRAMREGVLTLEETSNFGLLLRLEAAALGVPFLPARILMDGDLGKVAGVKSMVCPFTGELLVAIPALTPDVAIIHARRADRHGNVQAWGILGDTVSGARAARTVICTVEEIVEDHLIRQQPERTILPAHRVDVVIEQPRGAWPSYVHGLYDRDDDFYRAFSDLSRDAEKVAAMVSEMRTNPPGYMPDAARRAALAWPVERQI